MAGDVVGEDESSNKKFSCCKTRESSNIVCVNCGNVWHRSCLERDFGHLVCEKGDTRTKCCKLTSNDFIKKIEINKYISEIEQLKNSMKQLQEKYNLLENNNKLLMENNLLLQKNSKLLEEKIENQQCNAKHTNSYIGALIQNKPHLSHTQGRKEGEVSNSSVTGATRKVLPKDNANNVREKQVKIMENLINLQNDLEPSTGYGNKITLDEDDFQKVRKRRPKRLGTTKVALEEENTGFVGAERKAWIYIYRIKRHVTAEQVTEHIKKHDSFKDERVQVKELQSNPSQLKSFVVTAPLHKKDELYKPEFWPQNVGIKRFHYGLFQKYKVTGDFL